MTRSLSDEIRVAAAAASTAQTLTDQIIAALPSTVDEAMTAAQLHTRCELSSDATEVAKRLHYMVQRGVARRTDDKPYRYWRSVEMPMTRPYPQRVRKAAAQADAQPAVATNTGSVPSAPPPLLSAGGHAVPAGAAAPTAAPRATSDGFRCAIYDDGELVMEVDGGEVRLSRERTFRLCAYLERMVEVPGS